MEAYLKVDGGEWCYPVPLRRNDVTEVISLDVHHYQGNVGYLVHVNKASERKTETFETEAALLDFLRTFNLQQWTPEQVLGKLKLPPRPSTNFTKFQVVAREAAKGAAAGKG